MQNASLCNRHTVCAARQFHGRVVVEQIHNSIELRVECFYAGVDVVHYCRRRDYTTLQIAT